MIDQTTATILALAVLSLGILLVARASLDQERRIRKLESLLPKRHTHRNAMSLENVAAFLIAAQASMSEQQKLLDSTLQLVANMRANPNYKE